MSWKRPYNNKDINKSIRWVNAQPHNAGILVDAITVASEKEVRIAAVNRLHDVLWLKKAFLDDRNDADMKVRILDAMIRNGVHVGFRPISYGQAMAVADAASDPEVIDLLARHGHLESVRKITSQNLIYNMLTRFNRALYDSALFSEIGFNGIWTDYYLGDPDCESACMEILVEKMTNEGKYYNIFLDTPYPQVSRYFIRKLMEGGWINPDVLILDDSLSEKKRLDLLSFVNDEKVLDAFALDMDNSLILRKNAAYRITDPALRKKYCAMYETHQFEFVDTTRESSDDRAYITHTYRCIYCGECKSDDETYVY